MADKRYVTSPVADGRANNTYFSLGMPNKLGYLSLIGPDGKDNQLGLVETFDVEQDNGLTLDPQAFSNWLEPNPGTPIWTVNLSRSIVRGHSIPQFVKTSYSLPNGVTLDLQWVPFILAFNFDYAPPLLGQASFYDAQWTYHKVLIRNYRVVFAQGPNKRVLETMTAYGAGEDFMEDGVGIYKSETAAYSSDFFGVTGVNFLGAAFSGPTGLGAGAEAPGGAGKQGS